jgi:hypothetical protein
MRATDKDDRIVIIVAVIIIVKVIMTSCEKYYTFNIYIYIYIDNIIIVLALYHSWYLRLIFEKQREKIFGLMDS